jgi:cell division transport system ATP-binding protein
MVDQMRRRVVELDHGTKVRDQARGVYGLDSAVAAAGAGSPTGTMVEAAPVPVSRAAAGNGGAPRSPDGLRRRNAGR